MMRWKPLAWFLVSLLCFVGAIYFWQWGEKRAQQNAKPPAAAAEELPPISGSTPTGQLLSASAATNAVAATVFKDERFPLRLRNTPEPLAALLRSDSGLVLENALLDTARGTALPIPDHLRAQGDPGTYILQSRGVITEAFRRLIREAGGEVVAYVPNNAYLVRASAGVVAAISRDPMVQSTAAFEPYFKLKGDLLDLAVKQKLLPRGTVLSVVAFPEVGPATAEALTQLGGVVLAQDQSPFGPVLKVQVPQDALPAVAGLSGVQVVDRAYVRTAANDLVRPRLGVATSSVVSSNLLGLTGENVVIQVVDSGVDATHPDLIGRVFADPLLDPGNDSLTDTEGHGTHVAGIIAGDGSASTTVNMTNANGSEIPPVDGQFRGMAPAAQIVSVAAVSGSLQTQPSERSLQEAAVTEGALISNNSWRFLGDTSYDISAASYDAAVRDALPEVTGSQPVLFVFAAGNEGRGNEDGTGGDFDTIGSPSTAKNVITVGAIEQLRDLTNSVITTNTVNGEEVTVTNDPPFEFRTDTDFQVAYYSSRGNVGIGVEGDYGRFKPDVVAPGEFILSARSGQWDQEAYYNPTNYERNIYFREFIFPNDLNVYYLPVPTNAVEVTIRVATPVGAPEELPPLPIYVSTTDFPTLTVYDFVGTNVVRIPPDLPLTPNNGAFYFGVGNPTNYPIFVNITTVIAVTNENPVVNQAMKNLNEEVADNYRYESGTSMATPAISGTLALMQEFYETVFGVKPSPALLKALLINASRSTSPTYDFTVKSEINYQGWGIPNLPNILPSLSNAAPVSALHFFEQSPATALVTGQRHTRTVTVDTAALNQSLRFTLVWTDPPGNPVVGTKLVNDLDLIVTNLDTGEIYFGNDIDQSDYNQPWSTNGVPGPNGLTNTAPNLDLVNNVENVFLPPFPGTNFSVTVLGQRVNVNAVTANPENTVQDYVLVISSGDGSVENALTVVDAGPGAVESARVDYLAATLGDETLQGALVQNQRVGENSPLLGNTNGIASLVNSGVTNQWRFYAITNSGTPPFTNATFATFLASTIALPRMGVFVDEEDNATRLEGDIDLYVSTNAGLVDLEPAAINGAAKSLGPGGTESIVLTNAAPGIYYVGIKSEDHQAANFSFFGAFSLLPVSSEDENGVSLRGIPVPAAIPDGSPQSPKAALVLGVAPRPVSIRKVVVTNTITHELIGDLFGNLSHNSDFAVLNNKSYPLGNPAITNYTYVYDDLPEGDIPDAQSSDGPGSLRNFIGKEGSGVWLLSMVDDSQSNTGRVDNLQIRVEKSADTNIIERVIGARSWYYDVIDVPPDATNFSVCVSVISTDPLPVELYIRRGDTPTFELYDRRVPVNPPGACGSISTMDLPPLQPGLYYFAVYNPNSTAQTVQIQAIIEIGVDGRDRQSFVALDPDPILDDAVSYARRFVFDDRRIAGLEVGLVIEHPRVSDLAIHLVSPQGKRVLLVENRGGTDPNGLGGGSIVTNVFGTTVPGVPPDGANATNNILEANTSRGTLLVDYNFEVIPDRMRVYYDGGLIYDTGSVSGSNTFSVDFGPGTNTFLEIVMNEGGNTNAATAWSYTPTVISKTLSFLVLTDDTQKTTTPIKFAIPPLGGILSAPPGPPVFANGFEGAVANNYVVGSFIDGWEVITNDVDLFAGGYNGTPNPPEPVNFLDINGSGDPTNDHRGAIQTNIVLAAGQAYTLTFEYARNPDSVATGQLPQAEVTVGADSWVVSPVGQETWTNLFWVPFSTAFVAQTTNVTIQVSALTSGTNGVLFDNFIIKPVETLDRYYLPEESLNTLLGDNSDGLWTLELWDKRVGATSGPPRVVTWELRFIYETVFQTPIVLEPGVAITNDIPPGEILYLVVDVPNWASYATNTLIFATPDPVTVWFNQFTGPALGGTNIGDFALIPNSTGGTVTLDTAGIPPLLPGFRYYLGIENPGTNTVTIAYRVDFDVTQLLDGVPVSGTLGTNQFGGFQRYFYYDVSTNNPTALSFDLFNLSGNAELVARLGQRPEAVYDYGSFNLGTNSENITIFPDSTPVPLTTGRWYLGVWLAEAQPVDYTIQATEFTNDFSRIITLTNAIPYSKTNNGLAPIEDYYRFTVTDPVARLQFETFGATTDMTLLVRKGLPLPDFANYDYLSANPGTNEEYILVLPDSTPVTATAGEWFLTAINLSGQAGNYQIVATQWPVSGQPIDISTPQLIPGFFCLSWNSVIGAKYVVQAKVALSDATWVDLTPPGTITATGVVTDYCVPLPSPYRFFRVIDEVSGQPVNISTQQFAPGSFCFNWNSLIGAKYVVQAKVALSDATWVDQVPPGTITATSDITSFCEPLPSPYHFFRVIEGVAVDSSSMAQFRAPNISVGPGGVTISWQAPPIFQFNVEYSDVLPPVWTTVPGGPITSVDGKFTFTDAPPLPPVRYYRLVLLP